MDYEPNAFKVTLIFPLRDNEGRPFPESVWQWWNSEIARVLPGFTDMGGVEGLWQKKVDQNLMLFSVVERERLDEVRSFLREARIRFGQNAMYFEFHPVFKEDVR